MSVQTFNGEFELKMKFMDWGKVFPQPHKLQISLNGENRVKVNILIFNG